MVLRDPGGQRVPRDMVIGITHSLLSPLPVREMAPFGRGGLASQVPEEHWLLSNCHNLGKCSFLWT